MNDDNIKQQHKRWLYRDGTIVTGLILLGGFVLQSVFGSGFLSRWSFPLNLISGLVFVALLLLVHRRWGNHPLVKWLSGMKAALPAILGFTLLVLLMGFVRQGVQPKNYLFQIFGLTQLIRSWPFILMNVYLMILLVLTALRRLTPFSLKNFGFFLNHFGLFLILFSTLLGSSDLKRLTVNCTEGSGENQAVDEAGKVTVLPFTIRLTDFVVDEFDPKIVLVDHDTGKAVRYKGKDLIAPIGSDSVVIGNYRIMADRLIIYSEKSGDTYVESNSAGAVESAHVNVLNLADHSETSGWLSCGNYRWPPEAMKISDQVTLVMLPPEPLKFLSVLEIVGSAGQVVKKKVEVNHPERYGGWRIYQLGYDTEMGRWSTRSVLQLVRDPWLPLVYLGIFLMMGGALFLFLFGKPKDGGLNDVA